mmetsp:Transcript_82877/g.173528  ORF Transcript_82877/g.173528 Transcript_82877/m.173528 type:complete len:141 (+) Transcript_82877:107-529(+)
MERRGHGLLPDMPSRNLQHLPGRHHGSLLPSLPSRDVELSGRGELFFGLQCLPSRQVRLRPRSEIARAVLNMPSRDLLPNVASNVRGGLHSLSGRNVELNSWFYDTVLLLGLPAGVLEQCDWAPKSGWLQGLPNWHVERY